MRNEEKLKELLVKARAWMGKCDCRTKLLSPTDNAFLAGIEAALAEPVDDYDIDAELRLHKEDRLRLRVENLRLTGERDEARDEVERLKQEVRIAKHTVDMRTVKQQMKRNREAFQRGAEAMREAAAVLVSDQRKLWLRSELVNDIRTLPLPEDKL